MDTPNPKAGLGVLGVGAAACAACCAGPFLGFLAATGIASALGTIAFGAAGLLVALAVATLLHQRRRRTARSCAPTPPAPVPVAPPQRRVR